MGYGLHTTRGSQQASSQFGVPGAFSRKTVNAKSWPSGQGACRFPLRNGAGPWSSGSGDAILVDAIRWIPCGTEACSVTCLGYRCKPCLCAYPLLKRVRPLVLLSSKITKKARSHYPPMRLGPGRLCLQKPRGHLWARVTSKPHIKPATP